MRNIVCRAGWWWIAMAPLVRSYFIGVATSAYQIEGGNKGTSIWDTYTQTHHLTTVGNATNHIHLYQQDLRLMHEMGIRHYRFSISWTRVMPYSLDRLDPDGIAFYHHLIDECLRYNMTPFVTLYHWDLPQYLETDMNGWLDDRIIASFLVYAKSMFAEYGHKVRHWLTINEPLTTSDQGYGPLCSFAPGRCSAENRQRSIHYQLLAHAYVGHYYRQQYDGDIGIVLNANWLEPWDAMSRDTADREMDATLGLFLHPLIFGTYPASLRDGMPSFDEADQQRLQESFTLLAINHYTTSYVDAQGYHRTSPEWEPAQSSWLFDAPYGLSRLLQYIETTYNARRFPLYITECGFSQKDDGVVDMERVHYLAGYLREFDKCVRSGMTHLRGFFVWSWLDNFEWSSGYNETFGIIHVDRDNEYRRTPKWSAYVLRDLIALLPSS